MRHKDVVIGQVINPKRATLAQKEINKLAQKYGDKPDFLDSVIPDAEITLDLDKELNEVTDELGRYAAEDNFNRDVIDMQSARKLSKLELGNADEPFELNFVFESKVDYYKAVEYFGMEANVKKLMRLLNGT